MSFRQLRSEVSRLCGEAKQMPVSISRFMSSPPNGVPFIFITGHDPEVIPERSEPVIRLQEPVELRRVIGAVTASLDQLKRVAG